MINVSPVGRNASTQERNEFEKWDKQSHCREKMIEAIKKEFPDIGLTYVSQFRPTTRTYTNLLSCRYSIGGQISFDCFPDGWDKTYCLSHIEAEKDPSKNLSGIDYKNIHFFGDKAFPGGNDWEIYQDKRTIGHAVKDPDDTLKQIRELFKL